MTICITNAIVCVHQCTICCLSLTVMCITNAIVYISMVYFMFILNIRTMLNVIISICLFRFVSTYCYMSKLCYQTISSDDNCHFIALYKQPRYYLYSFNSTHVELVCVQQSNNTNYNHNFDTRTNCTIQSVPFTLVTDLIVSGINFGYSKQFTRYTCCSNHTHSLQIKNKTIATYNETNASVTYLNTSLNIFSIYFNTLYYVTGNKENTLGVIDGAECTIGSVLLLISSILTVPHFIRELTFEFKELNINSFAKFNWTTSANNVICFTRSCVIPIEDEITIKGCVHSFLTFGCLTYSIQYMYAQTQIIPFPDTVFDGLVGMDACSNTVLQYNIKDSSYTIRRNLFMYEFNNTYELFRTSQNKLSLILYKDNELYSYYDVPLLPDMELKLNINTDNNELPVYDISDFKCTLARFPTYTLYRNQTLIISGDRMKSLYSIKKGFGILEVDEQTHITLIIYDTHANSLSTFTGATGTCHSNTIQNTHVLKPSCVDYKFISADKNVSWFRNGHLVLHNRTLHLQPDLLDHSIYCASHSILNFNSTICLQCRTTSTYTFLYNILIIITVVTISILCICTRYYIAQNTDNRLRIKWFI